MTAIDRDLDCRLSGDQPPDGTEKFQKAERVKEVLRELGEANGEFAEFLRNYLFSSESSLVGADAPRRAALLQNLRTNPATVQGCTLSLPKQQTVVIGWNGKEHEYAFHRDSQDLWYGGYPNGDTISLREYSPARLHTVDRQDFAIGTQADMEQYNERRAAVETTHKEQMENRWRVRKVIDRIFGNESRPLYPARVRETPHLYNAAINMARDATEALHAAMRAFEELTRTGEEAT